MAKGKSKIATGKAAISKISNGMSKANKATNAISKVSKVASAASFAGTAINASSLASQLTGIPGIPGVQSISGAMAILTQLQNFQADKIPYVSSLANGAAKKVAELTKDASDLPGVKKVTGAIKEGEGIVGDALKTAASSALSKAAQSGVFESQDAISAINDFKAQISAGVNLENLVRDFSNEIKDISS